MLLRLNLHDPRPLSEQIADAVRAAVVAGEVEPGERLPPARDLAGGLGVNTNTVLRALRTLRDEGVLEFRRGRGISVARRPDARGALREPVRELLERARRYGYQPEDVIELIRESS